MSASCSPPPPESAIELPVRWCQATQMGSLRACQVPVSVIISLYITRIIDQRQSKRVTLVYILRTDLPQLQTTSLDPFLVFGGQAATWIGQCRHQMKSQLSAVRCVLHIVHYSFYSRLAAGICLYPGGEKIKVFRCKYSGTSQLRLAWDCQNVVSILRFLCM